MSAGKNEQKIREQIMRERKQKALPALEGSISGVNVMHKCTEQLASNKPHYVDFPETTRIKPEFSKFTVREIRPYIKD